MTDAGDAECPDCLNGIPVHLNTNLMSLNAFKMTFSGTSMMQIYLENSSDCFLILM